MPAQFGAAGSRTTSSRSQIAFTQSSSRPIINVQTGYSWDPATQISGLAESNIVGVEAPLWTETIITSADIDYMTYPRLPGYAEIGTMRR